MDDEFPILPFRSTLYTPKELFAGFSVDDPASYATTPDLRAFRSTRLVPTRDIGMLRALHDQSMTEARDDLLVGKQVVAIMGGHEMARDDDAYRQVARLAAALSRNGFLVVSGGGPGAMEATHLGALLAAEADADLDVAIDHLAAAHPRFPPGMSELVAPGGVIDVSLLADLHAWQVPVFEVLETVPDGARGMSLAVPTWFYGHEPPTPFATHIAKYFSNPLRKDGLLAIASDGVVYAPGAAGTLQEVFQDAAQNYYRTFHARFSPMVFLDLHHHWSSRYRVSPLLRELFGPELFEAHVCLTPSVAEVVEFLSTDRLPPGTSA
ncbi:MAG: hypothetical protein ABIP03_15800 [Aquihabitans sp.]